MTNKTRQCFMVHLFEAEHRGAPFIARIIIWRYCYEVARPESSKGVFAQPTPFEDSGRATRSSTLLILAKAFSSFFA
jgi:hypothetical protein